MANYFARKAGNINAVDVWATTPSGTAADVWSTFNNTDVLHSNNFAITVNVSTTVGTVRNDNANGATTGGQFTLSNGVTLTANVQGGGGSVCLNYAGLSGNSATITGNVSGSTIASLAAVQNSSSGTLNINGNIVAGSVSSAQGASNLSSGILNIVGNVTGGVAQNTYGVSNTANGVITVTGVVTGGTINASAEGLRNSGSGTVNITGSVLGTIAPAARNESSGTINITGNTTGGSSTSGHGAQNQSTGTMTITGNVTGGSIAGVFGAFNGSTGTLTIVGSATGSSLSVGASNGSTGILNVTRAVGNGWGIGTVGINSNVGVNSAAAGSQTRVEEFEFGALGQSPVSGAVSTPDLTTNVCLVHRLSSTKKTLVDQAASANFPAVGNVRSGTTFNNGNLVGTLAVPLPSQVAVGIATDNTVGTAALSPSDVWNALTSGMTTSGSIGARLKNASTLDSTGQQLADALSPVP